MLSYSPYLITPFSRPWLVIRRDTPVVFTAVMYPDFKRKSEQGRTGRGFPHLIIVGVSENACMRRVPCKPHKISRIITVFLTPLTVFPVIAVFFVIVPVFAVTAEIVFFMPAVIVHETAAVAVCNFANQAARVRPAALRRT
jgi:hypothetical protein